MVTHNVTVCPNRKNVITRCRGVDLWNTLYSPLFRICFQGMWLHVADFTFVTRIHKGERGSAVTPAHNGGFCCGLGWSITSGSSLKTRIFTGQVASMTRWALLILSERLTTISWIDESGLRRYSAACQHQEMAIARCLSVQIPPPCQYFIWGFAMEMTFELKFSPHQISTNVIPRACAWNISPCS
jgi:hypothetical protein